MPRIPKIFQKSWFNLLILLIITVGLTVFWNEIDQLPLGFEYKLYQEVNKDAVIRLPEGVEIVEEDGVKYVIDNSKNIKVKIDKDWSIVYFDKNSLSVGPVGVHEYNANQGFEVIFYKFNLNNSFKEWLDNWVEHSNCSSCYPNIEKIRDDLFKIKDESALGNLINYFWHFKNNIYQITVFDDGLDIDKILNRFYFN